MYNSVFKKVLLGLTVLAFISCDKDFNEIGSGIVGDDHYDFLTKFDVPVVANTIATGPVESRNLPINPLGVYKNPKFGTTIASFATQLELAVPNPTINPALHPEIESVELTVPYFSTRTDTDESGNNVYELDSVYGQINGKFNLQVYRSGYYMRDINYDGETQEAQLFYTNEGPAFDALKVGSPLNNQAFEGQNEQFFFSASEYEVSEIEEGEEEPTVTKFPPGMRLFLDNEVFEQAILNAPAGMLANNNVFKNYFRGLYFKVSLGAGQTDAASQLALLNFALGKVTVKYKQDLMVEGVLTRVDKSIVLTMTGNTASLVEQTYEGPYATALASTTDNDSRLWLKGGEGSIATIDLFGNDTDGDGTADALEQIREEDWLINEANLIFYIDRTAMGSAPVPNRIYLYDMTNKRPIIDYSVDGTTAANTKFKKRIYGGIVEMECLGAEEQESGDCTGDAIRYKIRLTNYINSLIKNNDSTNVRLGLSVTEDINNFSMAELRNPNPLLKNVVPTASVMSPLGTVLYGSVSGPGDPEEKRLRLEIYYTKPE